MALIKNGGDPAVFFVIIQVICILSFHTLSVIILSVIRGEVPLGSQPFGFNDETTIFDRLTRLSRAGFF